MVAEAGVVGRAATVAVATPTVVGVELLVHACAPAPAVRRRRAMRGARLARAGNRLTGAWLEKGENPRKYRHVSVDLRMERRAART